MPMPRRQTPRRLALFALALALLAATPCAMLAGEESCCGAAAKCGDPSESPCAQLAAAPCCGAAQLPLDRSYAPPAPTPTAFEAQEAYRELGALLVHCGQVRRLAPTALTDHATIRDVILRI